MKPYLKPLLAIVLCFLSLRASATGELFVTDTSGKTDYAVLIRGAQAYNVTGNSFAAVANANWTTYKVALTEQGTTGIYVADFPTAITTAGRYRVLIYQQAGGAPAVGDALIAQGTLDWSGTTQLTLDASVASTLTQATSAATTSTANGTALTTLTTRIPGTIQPQSGDAFARLGAPAGASVSADVAALQTAGTGNGTSLSTLLTRLPGVVQPQTGDSYARLGAPTGASVSADIAAVQTSSTNNGTAIAALPSANAVANAVWAATTRTLSAFGFTPTIGGVSAGVTAPASWFTNQPASSDTAGTMTLLARLTSGRATLLDNLSNLDAAVSTRLATTGYTAPTNPTDYARNNVAPGWYAAPPTLPTDYARNNVAPTWYAAGGDPFSLLTSTVYGAGTFGSLLKTDLDAAISSRNAVAPDNASVATILTRTDVATSTRLATGAYTAPANPTDYARNNAAPTWYTAPPTLPTTYPLSAGDESVLARLLAMTTSGNVFTAPALANAPTGTGGGGLTTPQANQLSALYGLLDPTGLALGTPVSRFAAAQVPNVTVGGYATGQDPATLLLASPIDGTRTLKQMLASGDAYQTGKVLSVTYNATTRTQVVVYARADGTTPSVTLTSVFDTTGRTTSRTVTYNYAP